MCGAIKAATLLGCACLLGALTSCGKEYVRVPVVQKVEVSTYRPLPKELTKKPSITYAKERSVEEVVRAYNYNTPQLEQCILQIGGIVELQKGE